MLIKLNLECEINVLAILLTLSGLATFSSQSNTRLRLLLINEFHLGLLIFCAPA